MNKFPIVSLRTSLAAGLLMIAAAIGAVFATPHLTSIQNAPSLEQTVPHQFGDWKEMPSPYVQVGLATGNEPNTDQPYDQTVMRSYVNSKGQVVMLALAWGSKQRQEVKVHRPDLCYVAQGFKVQSLSSVTFPDIRGAGGPVVGKRMVVMGNRGGEAVTYWMRIGNLYSEDAIDTRLHILKQGLAGHIPDGILVRASQTIGDVQEATQSWPVMENFLAELAHSLPPGVRTLVVR